MFKTLSNPCYMCRRKDCLVKEETKEKIDELIDRFPHLSVYCKEHLSTLTSYPEEKVFAEVKL